MASTAAVAVIAPSESPTATVATPTPTAQPAKRTSPAVKVRPVASAAATKAAPVPLPAQTEPALQLPVAPTQVTQAQPAPVAPAVVQPQPAAPVIAMHGLTGTVLLENYVNADSVNGCGGYGRFAAYQEGTQIVVTDAAGHQLGTGVLEQCELQTASSMFNMPGHADYTLYNVMFSFSLQVKVTAGSYNIRIGPKQWKPIPAGEVVTDGWVEDLAVV